MSDASTLPRFCSKAPLPSSSLPFATLQREWRGSGESDLAVEVVKLQADPGESRRGHEDDPESCRDVGALGTAHDRQPRREVHTNHSNTPLPRPVLPEERPRPTGEDPGEHAGAAVEPVEDGSVLGVGRRAEEGVEWLDEGEESCDETADGVKRGRGQVRVLRRRSVPLALLRQEDHQERHRAQRHCPRVRKLVQLKLEDWTAGEKSKLPATLTGNQMGWPRSVLLGQVLKKRARKMPLLRRIIQDTSIMPPGCEVSGYG